ncbi:TolC family protein, partial [Candidatus Pelagibacter bacterium]|nr:TolC family protein [Candidatus Pelagibacter bacterium]
SKKISVEQKIFSGFKGLNTFKKTELETQKANLSLKKVEQQTILDTTSSYFDLIFKSKNEKFNLSNVNLFQRQVDSDSARLQKGEITLTDLAQSESSLAGAKANLIKAKTELLSSKTNFERVTREKTSDLNNLSNKVSLNLPNSFEESLELANSSNVDLLISKLDYEISVKELNIERARLSPSASLNYSKSKNNDFSSTIDETDQETVKATITWPIIKGGENISSIKKSSYTDKSVEMKALNRSRKLISKINSALQRLKEGTYGFCEDTGEPIGLKRLMARPVATLSIEAQEKHERDEKIFVDD